MEYIVCFKTKDIEQFDSIKDATHTAFELTDEVKERLNNNPEDYKLFFESVINK